MDENGAIVAPGVKRNDYWGGYYLEGRKDALIASGLVKIEWLPDGTVRDKVGRVKRTRQTLLPDGRKVVGRERRNLRFCVYFEYSEEENERRHAAKHYEKAKHAEAKDLAHMPQTHEAYRDKSVRFFESLYEDAFREHFGPRKFHGYCYAPEVLEACELKLQEIREMLASGRTLYSEARHQAYIAEVKARTAEADPGFHTFLRKLAKA